MRALSLPNTLMHDQANACLAQWVEQLRVHPHELVQVDASALEGFDSSVLAVLLGLRRVVMARGGQLQVLGMNNHLRDLASLYGVLDLLGSV